MRLRIGICDDNVCWHKRLEEMFEKIECIANVTRAIESFYGEEQLQQFGGEPLDLLFWVNVKLKNSTESVLTKHIAQGC